jgi:hypothetical protein
MTVLSNGNAKNVGSLASQSNHGERFRAHIIVTIHSFRIRLMDGAMHKVNVEGDFPRAATKLLLNDTLAADERASDGR